MRIGASLGGGQSVDWLLQGTLYPDVIESLSYKGPSATIKTHHNVGGLPATMHLKLIEPLRELFKDEVRELGMALGIDEESVRPTVHTACLLHSPPCMGCRYGGTRSPGQGWRSACWAR